MVPTPANRATSLMVGLRFTVCARAAGFTLVVIRFLRESGNSLTPGTLNTLRLQSCAPVADCGLVLWSQLKRCMNTGLQSKFHQSTRNCGTKLGLYQLIETMATKPCPR